MKKILIANRGEIALRIVRACRDAGYTSVAIASEADAKAAYAEAADELHILPGTSPGDTYLNQAAILDVARRSEADAVHPGYGLLSENDGFAAAVSAQGLLWIGPSADAIAELGDKVRARAIARKVGAPLLPSLDDGDVTVDRVREFIAKHGLPVIVKAQNGGGGRGMRIVRSLNELDAQMEAAKREAGLAFGRSECFVEIYAERARHVETQCLADKHGKVVVLSTRDCTLQRRQQKLIEEAPAPFLTGEQEFELHQASIRILTEVEYCGAATCEFLIQENGTIAFLEVNTRVQVEHPVTEEVTGTDIIREMFNIAEGRPLELGNVSTRGHSIEFRINAEDPATDFRPTPGRISRMRLPGGPGIRLDFGYREGDVVPPYYDSLIGKLVVTGRNRTEALQRATRALDELHIGGIKNIASLHRAIVQDPNFCGDTSEKFAVFTRWIDIEVDRLLNVAAQFEHDADVEDHSAFATSAGAVVAEDVPPSYRLGIKAPLSGMVLELCVAEGDMIMRGDVVAIMESMKMEQTIIAEEAGTVSKINVEQGAFIEIDADLMGID